MIIFVTAGVITVTLAQGALLPIVVRWAQLSTDTDLKLEERLAETQAITAALDALPLLAAEMGIDPDAAEEVRSEYERYRQILAVDQDTPTQTEAALISESQQRTQLRRALLATKRTTALQLRDRGVIDDIVLRQLQRRLDSEEVLLP